jgi:hypothetical protein
MGMAVIAVLLIVIASIASLVGSIMMLIAAFRASITWGLLVLFVPFGVVAFIITHWQEAKRAFFLHLAAAGVLVVGFVTLVVAGASSARTAAPQSADLTPGASKTAERPRGHTPAEPVAAALAAAAAAAPAAAPASALASGPAAQTPTAPPTEAAAQHPPEPPAGDFVAVLPGSAQAPVTNYSTAWHDYGSTSISNNDPGGIRVEALARFIGRDVILIPKQGAKVRGRLLAADHDSVRIERNIGGGSARYLLSFANLQEVRLDG